MAMITITDEKLEEILIEVGIPILEIADLPYTSDQIKKSFIYPAMREYFKFFPIVDQVEYSIGSTFEIAFPDAETFDVADVRLVTNMSSEGRTADPLMNSLSILSIGRDSGRYGTRYDYGINRGYHIERASMSALINAQNAFRFVSDKVNRVVKGYSNIVGKVNVTWAKISLDYDSIPFDKEQEVRDLAASNLLRGWGGLISLQSSENLNDLDPGYFLDRADELKKEVFAKWHAFSKISIIRG